MLSTSEIELSSLVCVDSFTGRQRGGGNARSPQVESIDLALRFGGVATCTRLFMRGYESSTATNGEYRHCRIFGDERLASHLRAIANVVEVGFLPQSIKSPEQALAIILQGRELGIGPMAALNNISIIQGKISTVSPQLMLAMANATREVEDVQITSSEQRRDRYHQAQRAQRRTRQRLGPKTPKRWGWTAKTTTKTTGDDVSMARGAANLRVTFADVILGLYHA